MSPFCTAITLALLLGMAIGITMAEGGPACVATSPR